MSRGGARNDVPCIRGAAVNALRVEFKRLWAERGSPELSADVTALLRMTVSRSEWQPLERWRPFMRALAAWMREDESGETLRQCGVQVANSLFPGRYTFEEVRTTQWPAPVGSLMVELARAVFNFGRWEFEMVRFAIEGIVHAYDAEALSEDGRLIIESVVAALSARAMGADVRMTSARPEAGHITFRLRRRGVSLPPEGDQGSAGSRVVSERPTPR